MYRIQYREFSSNIIELGIEENGKLKWYPYLAPLCKKVEGDDLCIKVLNFLTKNYE